MKRCSGCKQEKDESEFNRKGKYLQSFCRECGRRASREHYRRNKAAHIQTVKANNKARQQEFLAWKATLKCEACGEDHPGCLDFHHTDPTQKDFSVSNGSRRVGWKRLMEEAKKCKVLCKNCHVKVHDGVIDLGV